MSAGGGSDPGWPARLDSLAERYALPGEARLRLASLIRLLVEDPHAPTAIRDAGKAVDDHVADSLVALELSQVRRARAVVDIGSGAGLPGLALAIALPAARVALLESAARKCEFLHRAVEALDVTNVDVVHARAEDWPEGVARHDLATARAVAAPDVVAEYAAPLLRLGGSLVAWRGRRDPEAEAALARAAGVLGLGPAEIRAVSPHPAAEYRHLYLISKVTDTPPRFPRRPGIALKRPLGAQKSGRSDRVGR